MKPKLACLSLAVFAIASCEKSGTNTSADDTSPGNPQVENREDAPASPNETTHGQRDTPDTSTRRTIDPPISQPVDASMIRPAGTSPEDKTWETLNAEEMVGRFSSNGIARIPKNVSDQILSDAANAGTPEVQVQLITQQAAAWHHINRFKEGVSDIPKPLRMTLIERLSTKYGDSWKDMVPELDEQVAASVRVIEFRLNGIPGMTPDESHDLIIKALEQHGPDYKTILSIAEQSAAK